jgi:hypothetical protein
MIRNNFRIHIESIEVKTSKETSKLWNKREEKLKLSRISIHHKRIKEQIREHVEQGTKVLSYFNAGE